MAQQKRRRNGKVRRRGRHSGLYAVLSAALILAAVAAACLIFFRIGEVRYETPDGGETAPDSGILVLGNQRYTDQAVIEVTGVQAGDNLFTLRGSKISRDILSRLPYVSTVKVRRRLPDQLIVEVTEGRALAAIAQDGKWWLVDAQGKLLEQAGQPGGLAPVTGIVPLAPAVGTYLAAEESQAARVERLKELLDALEENGMTERLERIDLSEDYRVTFDMDGRFTVHISPTLEKGMSYWLRRLAEYTGHDSIAGNHQSYTVEIMDDKNVRFIPK